MVMVGKIDKVGVRGGWRGAGREFVDIVSRVKATKVLDKIYATRNTLC